MLFNEFVEQLYNAWRRLHRLVICDSVYDRLDKKPYRTFNGTLETLMHVVRSTYRDIQENVRANTRASIVRWPPVPRSAPLLYQKTSPTRISTRS